MSRSAMLKELGTLGGHLGVILSILCAVEFCGRLQCRKQLFGDVSGEDLRQRRGSADGGRLPPTPAKDDCQQVSTPCCLLAEVLRIATVL